MDSKPWWASKTILTNLMVAVVAIAGTFGLSIGVELQTEIVALALAIGNIVLRVVTKQAIGA